MKERRSKVKRAGVLFLSVVYTKLYLPAVTILAAENKGEDSLTKGLTTLKTLVLSLVSGVGVVFFAWGIMDFGAAWSDRNTSEQAQAIKKVVGGIVMMAAGSIISRFT